MPAGGAVFTESFSMSCSDGSPGLALQRLQNTDKMIGQFAHNTSINEYKWIFKAGNVVVYLQNPFLNLSTSVKPE